MKIIRISRGFSCPLPCSLNGEILVTEPGELQEDLSQTVLNEIILIIADKVGIHFGQKLIVFILSLM